LYLDQARKTSISFLLSALNILNQFDVQFKSSKNQRLHVELAIMKLCYIQDVLNLGETLETAEKKKPEPRFDLKRPSTSGENAIVIVDDPALNGSRPVQKKQPDPVTEPSPVLKKTAEPVTKFQAPETTSPAKQTVQVNIGSGFSLNLQQIKENMKEALKNASEVQTIEVQTEAVDPDLFAKAWQGYLEYTFKKKLVALHTGIKNASPVIRDEIVVINVSSPVIRDMLVVQKQDMVDYMGQAFNIKPFILEVNVVQLSESETPKYLSEGDKLKRMMTKNPAFEDMVKRFDLRLDW
jgi:DNA polymerase III subunit gamma/tau